MKDSYVETPQKPSLLEKIKPDYCYYAKWDKMNLVEFVLILNQIDPNYPYQGKKFQVGFLDECYNDDIGWERWGAEESYFANLSQDLKDVIVNAQKDYQTLKRVLWLKKYPGCYDHSMDAFVTRVLIAEAKQKQIPVPEEFDKFSEEFARQAKEENLLELVDLSAPQKRRGRNTLLRLITMLIAENYNRRDFLNPKGLSQELEEEAKKCGYPISDTTIINILREANLLLPKSR